MANHDPLDSEQIAAMAADPQVQELKRGLFNKACDYRYSYNFKWLGRPIIQFPQDMVAIQEVIWDTKPQLIIETGIAHGGSLILSASLLELLGGDGRVLGIDIDIRPHNRKAIEAHPLAKRIDMIEGSSTDDSTADQVRAAAEGKSPVMVILDSNHTHEHVLRELQLYAPLVTKGCWLLVFDTVVEEMDPDAFPDRPWGVGDNPLTAVHEFLKTTDRFELDREIENKLLLTVAPGGWLRCVKD
ncbi:MAG: cephalosporin hydroxylase family protein [Planctomycetota bacterium]|nr:cephalosporin hydroxylase family protein [Planctomycetota bacterium]MDA1252848.1 cephalosporin hydroxylase family protein [Planctomycetota bacterium]